MMNPITQFALLPEGPTAANSPPRSRLVFEGEPAGTTLQGRCLDAQFFIDRNYLLIVDDDVPHEETLRFYLLSPTLRVVDRIELGGPYSPGVFADVRVVAPDRLEFSFAGNDRWQLRILREPEPWLRCVSLRVSRGTRYSVRRLMELSRTSAGA